MGQVPNPKKYRKDEKMRKRNIKINVFINEEEQIRFKDKDVFKSILTGFITNPVSTGSKRASWTSFCRCFIAFLYSFESS